VARGFFSERKNMKTYVAKPQTVERDWCLVDATDKTLGRLAAEVASRLRGKHKPTFSPHIDTGDHVIIVNADKVVLSRNKAEQKRVWRHSGYPGGIKSESFAEMLDRKPADAVRRSIKGMLPKGPLGRKMGGKLKVYAGATHPHTAQQPDQLTLTV